MRPSVSDASAPGNEILQLKGKLRMKLGPFDERVRFMT
jgi:hypothetical protein